MRYHAANRFQTRLAAPVDESQIYFVVESANGCPEVPFKLTVGTEIVNVIGVVGDTFTVQRGAEGTTPQGHPEGALVQNRWTAGTYEDLWDDVERLQGDVGAHKENTTDAHDIDKHFDATPEDNVHGLAGAVIVDAGSNENGSWVRFGNGIQICWHYFGTTENLTTDYTDYDDLRFYRYDLTVTYPKSFISSPAIIPVGNPQHHADLGTNVAASRPTDAVIRVHSLRDFTLCYALGYLAIGWWK